MHENCNRLQFHLLYMEDISVKGNKIIFGKSSNFEKVLPNSIVKWN